MQLRACAEQQRWGAASAQVTGKCGSVTVRLIPAPRGAGIVAARVPKKVLQMAGIEDCYTSARGSTKTLGNFVKVGTLPANMLQTLPTNILGTPSSEQHYVVVRGSEEIPLNDAKACSAHAGDVLRAAGNIWLAVARAVDGHALHQVAHAGVHRLPGQAHGGRGQARPRVCLLSALRLRPPWVLRAAREAARSCGGSSL